MRTDTHLIQIDEETGGDEVWDALKDYAHTHRAPDCLSVYVAGTECWPAPAAISAAEAADAERWLAACAIACEWDERTTPILVIRTAEDRVPTEIQRRFWRAEDRMLAARVPAGDRDGESTLEPVTVSGYYAVSTKSGRPAWARIEWSNGRHSESHCTYDPAAERVADELVIAGADPLWRQP